jgi:multidrug efflux system membrane fusion protein
MRPVKIAQQDEKDAVFSDGLEAGEMVVTAGFGRLEEGSRVKIGGQPPSLEPQPAIAQKPAESLTSSTAFAEPVPAHQGGAASVDASHGNTGPPTDAKE